MNLTLSKSQSISLEKVAGNELRRITLGLGWDPIKAGFFSRLLGGGGDIDLDASCILLDGTGQMVDLVWFRQLSGVDGAVQHSGDNRTGAGEGDDESITVDLQRLPATVSSLVFTVNSFTGQTFEQIANAYCRIVDCEQNKELARFNLAQSGPHSGLVMARLSRTATGWDFKALGTTTHGRTAEDLVKFAKEAIAA